MKKYLNPPGSNIFYNGIRVVDKKNNPTLLVLENGQEIRPTQIGKIDIECHDCKKTKRISLYYGIYEKIYLCMSCKVRGERNPFYGKAHDEKFKLKLSQERRGKWGVGEANPMYGKNVKDFVTPEKLEEMREKNRQISLDWIDNPFRKSMRDVIGDERFEQSLRKKLETRANWSEEKKKEVSQRISRAAKANQAKDPVGYSALKRKGGLATKAKPINYSMNKLEEQVANWLTLNNIRYTYSPIMSNGEKNFQFDFILHDYRILLECHGTYWHGDPRYFNEDGSNSLRKLNQIQINNMAKDKLKKEYAESKNFHLVVLWESDVKQNNYNNLTTRMEKYENHI